MENNEFEGSKLALMHEYGVKLTEFSTDPFVIQLMQVPRTTQRPRQAASSTTTGPSKKHQKRAPSNDLEVEPRASDSVPPEKSPNPSLRISNRRASKPKHNPEFEYY